MNSVPQVLTVAGSDSGGGAGIQADLKTFSALGCYGASVITALTAQNTLGVRAVQACDADFVTAQLDAVLSDIRIDAMKFGMLANASIVGACASALQRYTVPFVVLDTVMLSKNGHALLDPDAVSAMRELLLPQVDLITPNLPEAAALLGCAVAEDMTAMLAQAEALRELGAKAVLMKGGHLVGSQCPDILLDDAGARVFHAERIPTTHTHGTGCTLSAALTALRPQRPDWDHCVEEAKAWLGEALKAASRLNVGQGIGPVHHFHAWW